MPSVSFKDWFIAARPKTLTAALLPVLCGHLIVNSYSPYQASLSLTALALFCALLIQVGTNFFNDVIDFKNGVDSDSRSGPRRLIQSGKVSETRMRAAAHVCFLTALVLGLPLVFKGGLVILGIGIASILIGYSYSSPPLKIAYRGIAEPFVVLFFGIVAVVGIEWLHTRSMSQLGFVTGLQLGLLATVLMVINNIRDYKDDAEKGKRTLVARLGLQAGRLEVYSLYAGTLLLNLHSTIQQLPLGLISFAWILPATWVVQSLFFGAAAHALNKTLGMAALTHMTFGILRCLQLLW